MLPRHQELIRLARDGPRPMVDVGADHGVVAAALGAIASERFEHRIQGPGAWVVSDGLRAFGPVGTAIIAGMGARRILAILDGAPPVERLVLHAQDDPPRLRQGLAERGWCIHAEGLAPEARRFAEIVVARRGKESADGFTLDYGPRLIDGDAALRNAHFHQLAGWLDGLERQTRKKAVHSEFAARLRFVRSLL